MTYEYGVAYNGEVHRSDMTFQEALEWIEAFEEDGGRIGVFYVIQRPLPEWEICYP